MRKNYLLPNYFKRIGLIMFIPFLALCIWLLAGPGECNWFIINVPALFTLNLANNAEWFTITTTDPVNEICMTGLLISIVFIALAKEKDEDEMTAVVRMQSFVWSFWCTAASELICILLVYDMAFLYFAFASIFIFFILFIIKFNSQMSKIRRA